MFHTHVHRVFTHMHLYAYMQSQSHPHCAHRPPWTNAQTLFEFTNLIHTHTCTQINKHYCNCTFDTHSSVITLLSPSLSLSLQLYTHTAAHTHLFLAHSHICLHILLTHSNSFFHYFLTSRLSHIRNKSYSTNTIHTHFSYELTAQAHNVESIDVWISNQLYA